MALTINGKLVKHLPKAEGDSQRGHWVRGGFVVEFGDEYPRKAAFSLFGEDKVAEALSVEPGTTVQVKFVPESREFQERWYTDLRCIGITATGQQAQAKNTTPVSQTGTGQSGTIPEETGDYDDLPF